MLLGGLFFMILYDRQHVLSIILPFQLLVPCSEMNYYKDKECNWGFDVTVVPHNENERQAWEAYIRANNIVPLITNFDTLIIIGLEPDTYLEQSSLWFSREWLPVPEGPH